MIVVTTEKIEGRQFQTLTMVRGCVVQSKNFGTDLGASFKTLVGGEIKGYTDMMNQAREIATTRMIEDASRYGADAIVGVRYASSSVMQGACEILCYGTAVKLM